MPNYPPAPSRRALYRHAKKTLYKALVRRWTGPRVGLDKHIRAFLRGKRHSYLLRLVRQHAFALAVATALLTGATAHASPPIELSDIAMDANAGGFVMNGEAASDGSGRSLSGAGDVNGDGIPDFIVGAPGIYPSGSGSGKSYVVFGKADGAAVELSSVAAGTGGFVINGEAPDDRSGLSVSGAGDVNGDGLADLIVASPFADPNGYASGKSYVVFGKADGTAVELSSVAAGTGGFVMNGEAPDDRSGLSVSGAGDVNGDGLDDLIVGSPLADPNGLSSGRSYVVFGKTDGTAVELSSVAAGTGGFVVNGELSADYSGLGVSAAGDVNGDGLADLIVASPLASPNGSFSGKSYVVFGKADGTAVELSSVSAGSGGFVMNGEAENDQSGRSVSAAGDVNGDGLADLIVGAELADPNGLSSGRSYVVFGKADGTTVELSNVAAGTGGFVTNGEAGDQSGFSVSGAGDVNGDGLADVIVGALAADPNGSSSGRSYVVFGKADGTAVELSSVASGIGGFAMNGEAAGDLSGISVSRAGDVNGDGLADLIVGASHADPNGSASGKSYVVFSPIAGPVQWVDFAFSGIHEGTEALPFQRLAHAVTAVTPGGVINIKGNAGDSDSPETLLIDKAMTINAINGTVSIGNPAARSTGESGTTAEEGFVSKKR